jgi:hypothetical protein
VLAAPQFYDTVERVYDPARFELVHVSAIDRGEKSGARRYLYEAVPDTSEHRGFRRYLFRLRGISRAGGSGTKAR